MTCGVYKIFNDPGRKIVYGRYSGDLLSTNPIHTNIALQSGYQCRLPIQCSCAQIRKRLGKRAPGRVEHSVSFSITIADDIARSRTANNFLSLYARIDLIKMFEWYGGFAIEIGL